jgi:hypothetical protein
MQEIVLAPNFQEFDARISDVYLLTRVFTRKETDCLVKLNA